MAGLGLRIALCFKTIDSCRNLLVIIVETLGDFFASSAFIFVAKKVEGIF